MSKHSVGAWDFHAKLSGSENHRGFKVYAQPSGWYIADVSPIDEDGAEGKANARLIAAAPDLLRELSHLVRLLGPVEKDGGLNVPGLATLNGARAAIAKATGEQS